MQRILVWDLPTRLFHALLAGSFAGAFLIANTADDESPVFPVHMLLGAVMAGMVVLRVVWGFLGSRWARFGSFLFGPAAVLKYARGILSGAGEPHVGHNPGSSWGIFATLGLTLLLALTGANMANGGELVEELHEVCAFALLAVVLAHVAGVALHTVRTRENITLSMVHGHKQGDARDAIPSAHAGVALLFLALTAGFGYGLLRGYDATRREVTLPLLGTTITLGEAEDGQEGGSGGEQEGGAGEDEDEDEDED